MPDAGCIDVFALRQVKVIGYVAFFIVLDAWSAADIKLGTCGSAIHAAAVARLYGVSFDDVAVAETDRTFVYVNTAAVYLRRVFRNGTTVHLEIFRVRQTRLCV